MQYRQLGGTGLRVSALGFGTWFTTGSLDAWGLEDEQQAVDDRLYQCVKAAFDAGVNMFDTAEGYDMGLAEASLGRVLQRCFKEGLFTRNDIVISTKWIKRGSGPNDAGLSAKRLRECARGSLERLQLDFVDIVFAHRPDLHTPIEEVVRSFASVVTSGRAAYWGTSEWPAVLIERAKHVAARLQLPGPVCEQPQYNMFAREKVESEFAMLYDYWHREGGLGLTTWSPLAYGLLSGKYNDGIPEGSRFTSDQFEDSRQALESNEGKAKLEKVRKLSEVAGRLGCTTAQLALRWCLLNDRVSCVIMGASKVEQIADNLKAIDIRMTPEIVEEIESILENKPTVYAPPKWSIYQPASARATNA